MEWISVKDRLPQLGIQYRYLFTNGKGEVTFGYAYDPKEGCDTGNSHSIWINDHDRCTNEVATHWMPLPEPTNEDAHKVKRPDKIPEDHIFCGCPECGECACVWCKNTGV